MNLKRYQMFCVFFICCSLNAYSQYSDSLAGFSAPVDTVNKPIQPLKISIPVYFQLLTEDFIQQAISPLHIQRKDLLKITGFAILTAGIMHFDEPINHFALKLDKKSSTLRAVSPVVTNFGGKYEIYTIGAIGAWSYLFKNQKLKNTTLLATQAYLTSGVWVSVIKFITGRSRPTYFDPNTQEGESIWHGMFYQFRKNSLGQKPDGSEYSSFPSGHTTVAFAVATVYAEEYKDKPWVPVLAYTSASLVGLSRITENKHWASDVLVGSALGFLCGQQVVRNYHRHERMNAVAHKKKNTLDFNLSYMNKSVMPELIYTFR